MTCWLRHKWNTWEQYEECGTAFPQFLTDATRTTYSEIRQRRTCILCGKAQDEWVSGPFGDSGNWTKIRYAKASQGD